MLCSLQSWAHLLSQWPITPEVCDPTHLSIKNAGQHFWGSKQLCRCHSNTKRRQGLSPCVCLCAPIARPNTSRSCPIPIVHEFRYPTKAINTDTLQKTCDIVQYISDRIEKTGELDLFHGPSRPFFTYGEGQERYWTGGAAGKTRTKLFNALPADNYAEQTGKKT